MFNFLFNFLFRKNQQQESQPVADFEKHVLAMENQSDVDFYGKILAKVSGGVKEFPVAEFIENADTGKSHFYVTLTLFELPVEHPEYESYKNTSGGVYTHLLYMSGSDLLGENVFSQNFKLCRNLWDVENYLGKSRLAKRLYKQIDYDTTASLNTLL